MTDLALHLPAFTWPSLRTMLKGGGPSSGVSIPDRSDPPGAEDDDFEDEDALIPDEALLPEEDDVAAEPEIHDF